MNTPVTFGPFAVDAATGHLRRDGALVSLQDLPFRLLTALLERPGEVVTRAELAQRLWGTDTFVDSVAGLNTAVAKLREALGDDANQPAYVETLPKRGYRFVGTVSRGEVSVVPSAARDEPKRDAERRRLARRPLAWATAALVAIALVAVAGYQLRAGRAQTRVAVILFDNETDRPEMDRLSQGLTDATVFALTAQPKVAVIGNAAILRTKRPFRDIAAVRDTLHADFIVIGQVQNVDETLLVRAHLIRASDQAHVWVGESRKTGSEATLQSDVSGRIAAAVAARVR